MVDPRLSTSTCDPTARIATTTLAHSTWATRRFSFSQKLTGNALYRVLTDNFTVRYRGNRSPHGVYLHAPTFQTVESREPYNRALRYMAARRVSWFVTSETLIRRCAIPFRPRGCSAWI